MKVSRERFAQNRENIVDVAGALFRERGYDGVGIAALLPDRLRSTRRRKAAATLAGMVGALVLARAVGDEALSQEILASAATELERAAMAS